MESEPRLQRRTWPSAVLRMLVLLVGFVCMVGFAVALAKVTLQPSAASVDLTHTNLRPGDSIRMYLDQPAFRDTVKQIGGNLLLGVPFGVLLPVLIPKARGSLRVVLVTAVVMLLVEAAQGALVEGRAFDIDDVILNTTGALVGYLLLGRRLGRALHPRRHHWWQRSGGPAVAASERPAPKKQRPTPKKQRPAPEKRRLALKKRPSTPKKRGPAPKKSAPAAWWRSLRPGRR
ncbi:VanZ family protein [Streptomyces sp. NPDC051322]|uniref:VanZ family protein n=1 Tax=Streptomyces sp. NPDC051322 TaxID=3154645 RepID=UPI00344B2E6C